MRSRIEIIRECLAAFSELKINHDLVENDEMITCEAIITINGIELEITINICASYPFQIYETESIRFITKNLTHINHVNSDGSICIHTTHNPNLTEKLKQDIQSLLEWMNKYYINNHVDENYEHIVVPYKIQSYFLFTQIAYKFTKYEQGIFQYSKITHHNSAFGDYETFIIQALISSNKKYSCQWNEYYKSMKWNVGIYIYLESPPVIDKRFIVQSWIKLENHLSTENIKYIYDYAIIHRSMKVIPILIGYTLPNNETYWQCCLMSTDQIPITPSKIGKKYYGKLLDQEITWIHTIDCSYHYFFGRGLFDSKITDSKILIIGIGAVGSVVSKILCKGGCKHLDLVDYDIKEPANVCRSEYSFKKGVLPKIDELSTELTSISPFIEVKTSSSFINAYKTSIGNNTNLDKLNATLQEYDLVFDCSTDYDVAFILDKIDIPSRIFSISITNNAEHLICATSPNLYNWVLKIAEDVKSSTTDLYNPTGCWSPTFYASYNDIVALVSLAVKNIVSDINRNSIGNFYITHSENQYSLLTVRL